jgi:uncharacterized protein involved in response to NO
MDSLRIDPTVPVKDLLARYPHLSSALAANGLDTCCGGMHPLDQACRAKGVPLHEVVRDLQSAHAAAESHAVVPPTMTIREVLRRFPSTRAVLERYGLADCGGDEGPEEPIAWFATVHRLPLEELLRDVRAAASSEPTPAVPAAPSGAAPAQNAFSPHFVIGSLALTLTLGATTGMINLIRIAAGGEVPIDHRQIHGHTQVLGFATLFLMGIAYHALPRILGVGAAGFAPRRAVRTGFWLMFWGVVLRNLGQPFGLAAWGRAASLLSAVLELASAAMFVYFVFGLLRRAVEGKYDRRDPLLRFVRAGTITFAAAMAVVGAQGIWLAGHVDSVLPASLNETFYFAALYGFLLAWIYGFGHRVVSLFLGVGTARPWTATPALALQSAGVVLFAGGWLLPLSGAAPLALRDAGLFLAASSAIVFLAGTGLVWRRSDLPMLRTPGNPTFAIRAAFSCLALWAVLEIAAVLASRLTRLPAQNLWWADAARHVFTIGFLTLLIVGMSLRIIPVFSGRRLWSPGLAHATYGLLLLGAAMRLLQYPAAFHPVLYQVGSWMGIPVVLALLLFVFNLMRTIRGGGERAAPKPARPVPASPFASTLPVR